MMSSPSKPSPGAHLRNCLFEVPSSTFSQAKQEHDSLPVALAQPL